MGNAMPWLVNPNSPPYADLIYQQKWQMARDTAEGLVTQAQEKLAGRVTLCGADSHQLVVFNALSWTRSDPVEFTLPTSGHDFQLIDSKGKAVPVQISTNNTAVFVAQNVPPLGYDTYCLVSGASAEPAQRGDKAPPIWDRPFSNHFFRLTPGFGGLKSVVDLATGAEREFEPQTNVVKTLRSTVMSQHIFADALSATLSQHFPPILSIFFFF
jgi:alpha-mannosidase